MVEQIAAKHQKTSEYHETDEDDMIERLTRMLGNLLLDYNFPPSITVKNYMRI
jgi:hypothetical protein